VLVAAQVPQVFLVVVAVLHVAVVLLPVSVAERKKSVSHTKTRRVRPVAVARYTIRPAIKATGSRAITVGTICVPLAQTTAVVAVEGLLLLAATVPRSEGTVVQARTLHRSVGNLAAPPTTPGAVVVVAISTLVALVVLAVAATVRWVRPLPVLALRTLAVAVVVLRAALPVLVAPE
jgi:hypothetical protein